LTGKLRCFFVRASVNLLRLLQDFHGQPLIHFCKMALVQSTRLGPLFAAAIMLLLEDHIGAIMSLAIGCYRWLVLPM